MTGAGNGSVSRRPAAWCLLSFLLSGPAHGADVAGEPNASTRGISLPVSVVVAVHGPPGDGAAGRTDSAERITADAAPEPGDGKNETASGASVSGHGAAGHASATEEAVRPDAEAGSGDGVADGPSASHAGPADEADVGSEDGRAADDPAVAAEEAAHAEDPDQANGFQRAMDKIHAGISVGVEASAKRVDSFFADDRFYTDATASYLRVSGQTTFEDGEDDSSQARVRLRLDLPGTRERLRLFVEGGDPDAVEESTSETIPEALDDNDYNIGLETQIPNTEKWDLRPAIGVKASSSPDPFIRMRAIRYERLDGWLFRFATGVSEFVDDGTEVGARVDFDRKLNPDWLFRTTTRAEYRDSKDRIDALQQFSLFQKINDRVGFAYDVGVRADDDPDWEVDQYFTQFRSRFRVYRKWLFVELKPQVVFREEDDFDPSFLFSVRLDVIFGERYVEGRSATPGPANADGAAASSPPGP